MLWGAKDMALASVGSLRIPTIIVASGALPCSHVRPSTHLPKGHQKEAPSENRLQARTLTTQYTRRRYCAGGAIALESRREMGHSAACKASLYV